MPCATILLLVEGVKAVRKKVPEKNQYGYYGFRQVKVCLGVLLQEKDHSGV